jgi:cyclopropane-fatty-acyl-phospholipid synthase
MNYWSQYWSKKERPGHRQDTEAFYERLAREQSFHLYGGHSLLDFGCGSADVLLYHARTFPRVVGVDFSDKMLAKGRKRLNCHGMDHVDLLHADDKTVWNLLHEKFDRITASGVIQYFDIDQIGAFLKGATDHLNAGGKIIFFDIVDPWIFPLFEIGLVGPEKKNLRRALKNLLRINIAKLSRKLKGLPATEMGTTHDPKRIMKMAQRLGLTPEYVSSMHYEYRYHLIFTYE